MPTVYGGVAGHAHRYKVGVFIFHAKIVPRLGRDFIGFGIGITWKGCADIAGIDLFIHAT